MIESTTAPVTAPVTTGGDPPVLAARGLVKEFRRGRRTLRQRVARAPDHRTVVRAVDGIDVRLAAGEVLGVLGPNGAGKSTLIKMLSSLLVPTSGTVSVGGVDAVAHPAQARRRLGVMLAGDRSVYWKLTGRENLEYFAALHFLPKHRARERITEVLRAVQMEQSADDYVERYSTGMRLRLSLARAIIHEPPVLLLDEPTSGLDPLSRANFQGIVRGLRRRGTAVLLATHDLVEAEQLCDRVTIIDRGQTAFEGGIAEAKGLVPGEEVIAVELDLPGRAEAGQPSPGAPDRSDPASPDPRTQAVVAWLTGSFRVSTAEVDGATLRARLYTDCAPELMPTLMALAKERNLRVRRADVLPVSLVDVFFSVTGHGFQSVDARKAPPNGAWRPGAGSNGRGGR